MNVGWHYLPGPGGEDDPFAPMGASTFLDLAPTMGMRSPERLCRVFFTGRPQPQEIAQKARAWHAAGCRVVVANEPNLPQEGFGGGPDDYAVWFASVKDAAPGVRLYWAGMSPGAAGWREWYGQAFVAGADGIAAHAYGTFDQMRGVVEYLAQIGLPIWLSEVNFGAGQVADRTRWADEHLRPFLDWCSTVPQVEAVCYFAYRWPDPDMALPTPVDGAGTRIETVLRGWAAPEPSPAASGGAESSNPDGGGPVAVLRGIDVSNNQGTVDLGLAKADGIAFVAIKASGDEGRGNVFLDAFFPENWHQANAHELVRIAYHYARPSAVTPAQSVTTLERAIQAVGGLRVGDNVALDVEDPAVPDGVSLHVWVAEWLALAEQVFGVAPYRYSAHYYTSTHDLEHDDLAKYPVWWASYQAIKPAPSRGWSPIKIWQNSASGRVPGVSGDVDTNIFEGTRVELLALGKLGLPELVEPAGPAPAADVVGALDVLWNAVGPDEEAQRHLVAVKVRLGLQFPDET